MGGDGEQIKFHARSPVAFFYCFADAELLELLGKRQHSCRTPNHNSAGSVGLMIALT